MKNLTKKVRHQIYVEALNHTNKNYGLCSAIKDAYIILFDPNTRYVIDKHNPYRSMNKYPEVYKHKPIGATLYWWQYNAEGLEKRIAILKQAIKETE